MLILTLLHTAYLHEEYVLVVGVVGRFCSAEFDVAIFWPLGAEVLSPAEQDDFSDL